MENQKGDSLYKWLALMVVVVGTFMAILDSSIVNIAIPKMMAVFGVSTDKIKWVLTAYMLTMGAVIPLTGFLGDTFGTKKTYIWALVMFTIGSALCGMAWSSSAMIVARVIQALGGGMIMPISMSIIYQVVPLEERGMALGLWGIAAMAAPAIGPTLSGYIVQNLDWRLIFTVNIPVGVMGVILAILILEESPKKPFKGFDFLGFITSTLGLVSILYVLGEGSSIDWGNFENIFLLMFGAFMLILFVVNELTLTNPMLDLRLLKIWPFTLSILIASTTNIALFGGVFLLPLFLQNLRGLTAMQTGMLLFPGAIATGITMPIGGKLFDKFGAKPVVIPGLIILVVTTYELSKINLNTSSHMIMMLMALRGMGMGLAMMPSTTAGMNAVPKQLVGGASALSNVIRQVAGSVGITVITTILENNQVANYAKIAAKVNVFHPGSMQVTRLLQGLFGQNGLSPAQSQGASVATLFGVVQQQAFVQAIDDTFLVTVFIAVFTIPLAMMINDKRTKSEPGESHVIME